MTTGEGVGVIGLLPLVVFSFSMDSFVVLGRVDGECRRIAGGGEAVLGVRIPVLVRRGEGERRCSLRRWDGASGEMSL